jgi:hypothetical protein
MKFHAIGDSSPPNSLLKQEGLQLAEASFREKKKSPQKKTNQSKSPQTFTQLSPRPVVLLHQHPVKVRPLGQLAAGPLS